MTSTDAIWVRFPLPQLGEGVQPEPPQVCLSDKTLKSSLTWIKERVNYYWQLLI